MREPIFRYSANGEGIFSAGKRLLPEELVEEALRAKSWLRRPALPPGSYRFYLTLAGRLRYESTLLPVHRLYLSNISIEETELADGDDIVFRDEYQIVLRT